EAIGNFFFDFSNLNFSIAAISQVPQQPALQAGSDTGSSSSDRITRLNNSSPANALSFDVGGTVAGATVSIYSDGTLIGSAAASDVAGNTVTGAGLPYNFLYVGGSAAHTIYVQRGGSGNSEVQVFKDTLPDGTPDFVATYATLTQIAFEGSESNDTVTVDFVN